MSRLRKHGPPPTVRGLLGDEVTLQQFAIRALKQISNYSLEWFRAANQTWWVFSCIANLLGCALCVVLCREQMLGGELSELKLKPPQLELEASSRPSAILQLWAASNINQPQRLDLNRKYQQHEHPGWCLTVVWSVFISRNAPRTFTSAVNKDGLKCVSCFHRHVPTAVHRFWPQARLDLLLFHREKHPLFYQK